MGQVGQVGQEAVTGLAGTAATAAADWAARFWTACCESEGFLELSWGCCIELSVGLPVAEDGKGGDSERENMLRPEKMESPENSPPPAPPPPPRA